MKIVSETHCVRFIPLLYTASIKQWYIESVIWSSELHILLIFNYKILCRSIRLSKIHMVFYVCISMFWYDYEGCSKINRTEAVTLAQFNIHIKLNKYHKSEHVLHILRQFQQIPFTNNNSITNTNNKGSATRRRSSLHKRRHWRHIISFSWTFNRRGTQRACSVYKINYIIYYYVENQLSTYILFKVTVSI